MKSSPLKNRSICDLQTILKLPQGRRALWRILQAAQVRQHGFVPGDAYATAFHCGQRSIGLFLLDAIEQAHSGAYQQMRSEYQAEVTVAQQKLTEQEDENV